MYQGYNCGYSVDCNLGYSPGQSRQGPDLLAVPSGGKGCPAQNCAGAMWELEVIAKDITGARLPVEQEAGCPLGPPVCRGLTFC